MEHKSTIYYYINLKETGLMHFIKNINQMVLENLYYISQIILAISSTIIIVATFVYGIYQYRSQRKHNKIAKAADMAKLYEETFIGYATLLFAIYKEYQLDKITKNIDLDKIKDFNEKELSLFISEFEMNSILKIVSSLQVVEKENIKYVKEKELIVVKGGMKEVVNDNDLAWTITQMMNKLEYFCICFNSRIASDRTVYQSLHSSFFSTVQYLYPFIVMMNKKRTGKDKLYTNIIKTYNKWREIYSKQNKKEERLGKKAKSLEIKLNKVKQDNESKAVI